MTANNQITLADVIVENHDPLFFQPETEVNKLLAELDKPITDLAAKTENEVKYIKDISASQRRTAGMDAFDIETFERLVENETRLGKSGDKGRLRNAVLFVLQANYGMRFSDVTRLRWCHLIDADGAIKPEFSVPSGEKKTGKHNIYYNNNATKYALKLLHDAFPKMTMYDFLFPSVAGRRTKTTLLEVEIKEKFDVPIERVENRIHSLSLTLERHKQKYELGDYDERERARKDSPTKSELEKLTNKLEQLKAAKNSYISISPNPNMLIVESLSWSGVERVLKIGLQDIGIIPLNIGKFANNGKKPNVNKKYNTHSLRKTFGDYFYAKGYELKVSGVEELVQVDASLLKLLQDKYMHTDSSITRCYSKIEETAFRTISINLNLGFEALMRGTGVV